MKTCSKCGQRWSVLIEPFDEDDPYNKCAICGGKAL